MFNRASFGSILSRLLQYKSQCNIESFSVEINLRKRKSFLNCLYNLHRNLISRHLECLNRVIDENSKTYDNFIFIGAFNVGIDENSMQHFCDINCLKSLIKVSTCLKNPDKTTSIDNVVTNQQCFWKRPLRLHLLTVTEFKMGFQRLKPLKIIAYRYYKNLDNFRSDIVTAASNVDNFGRYV